MSDVDFVAGAEIKECQVIELAGERVLIDRAAADAQEVVFDSVAILIPLKCMKVAGDDGVDAVFHQQRVDSGLPVDAFDSPEWSVYEKNDGFARIRLFQNPAEPGDLSVGDVHVSAVE